VWFYSISGRNLLFIPTKWRLRWLSRRVGHQKRVMFRNIHCLQSAGCKWGLSVNKWSDVMCSDVEWTDVIYVKWSCFEFKWSEVKWVTVKSLGTKVPCTLGWPYTEGTWLYCDYFIWCVFHLVCILYCGCFNWFCNMLVCMCVGFVMCGCFDNCVGVLVIWVLGFVVCCIVCTVFLYCFVYVYLFLFCMCVRTTATEWKLNWSK
jgi:hypothetical protein